MNSTKCQDFGQVQTLNFSCAKLNANEEKPCLSSFAMSSCHMKS